jgi:tRNA-2-methylthio-N6-dimethylallyladenosine synthase
VATGEGRKNAATHRRSGRARDGRLVHFSADEDLLATVRPGDVVTTTITAAHPYHLIADAGVASHRRTRAGDAYERGTVPKTAPIGVGLGLPSIGAPAPLPATTGCSL